MEFSQSAWVAIAFILFFILVGKRAYQVLTSVLDNKKKLIEDELNHAIKLREQAQIELNDSISYAIDLKISTGSIRIWCTDWDEKTETQNNWEDDLNVSIDTNEFIFWLDNVAYK